MKIDEATFGRMPAHLQALFRKVPNPGRAEVMDAFARFGELCSGSGDRRSNERAIYGDYNGHEEPRAHNASSGTAARFFFCAKADASERVGSHPTVKPVALMEWLVRLVCPPNGRILDPFCWNRLHAGGVRPARLRRGGHRAGRADGRRRPREAPTHAGTSHDRGRGCTVGGRPTTGNPAVSRRKKQRGGNGEALAGKPPVVKKKRKGDQKQIDWSTWTGDWPSEARATLGDIWPKPTIDPLEQQ